MDTSTLKPGDDVLVHAQVTKRVDDGEGSEPVVLISIDHAHGVIGNVSVLVKEDQIEAMHARPVAAESEPYPLGTLDVDHATQRAAMDKPA